MMPVSFRRGRAVVFALLAAKSVLLTSVAVSYAEMPHNRRCDIAQDNPGNLNPAGGNAIMFGLCSGIQDFTNWRGTKPTSHLKCVQLWFSGLQTRQGFWSQPVLQR